MVVLLFAGVCMLVIAGCGGSTVALNPELAVSYTPSGINASAVPVTGFITLSVTEKLATGDQIKNRQWTQVPEDAGLIDSPTTPVMTWTPKTADQTVKLIYTVTTVNGGRTELPVFIHVVN
jgi:hypothetical protein